jgi:hypothetical protein
MSRNAIGACLSFAIIAMSATTGSAFAASGDFYETHFSSPTDLNRWAITGPTNWQIANGWLIDPGLAAKQILTVANYDPAQSDTIESDVLLEVNAWIGEDNPAARVGAVFNFTDADNYHEVLVSAAGEVIERVHIGGLIFDSPLSQVPAPGVRKWFSLSVRHSQAFNNVADEIWVNGVPTGQCCTGFLPDGDVGLTTFGTTARFDDFRVRSFGRLTDPYLENFDRGTARGWNILAGRWFPQGTLDHSDTAATALIASPIVNQLALDAQPSRVYTFKTSLFNRYRLSGNVAGVAFIRSVNNYDEVLFSHTGVATLRSFRNGVRTIRGTAPWVDRGQIEIEVGYRGNQTGTPQSYVKANGRLVFQNLPFDLETGEVGLVAHNTQALFDWVEAAPRFFRPFQANFNSSPLPSQFSPSSGSRWQLQNGQLNSFGIGANDFGLFNVWHDFANLDLRARVTNHYGASGNRAALIYGFRAPDDYYEVAFNANTAFLNRVLKETRTTIASAPYTGGGPHQPFDVQLVQNAQFTTLKVNGVAVFNRVSQPGSSGGLAGVATHFTNASFDNVSINDAQL